MSNVKIIIDTKRQEILDSSNHLLIIGGPGSGKTTIGLLKAFKYLESENLQENSKVLFLSFSRNARSRIEESMKVFTSYKSLWKRVRVETFHSFFLTILKSHGYLIGIKSPIDIILPHQEDALKSIFEDEDLYQKELVRLKREEGKIPFDSFAILVMDLLSRSKKISNLISNTYPLILIDEVQDTNDLQWSIIEKFKHLSQLIMLGDLDQQIFDFLSGVGPERVDEIRKDLVPQEIDLSVDNYRNGGNAIRECASDILNGRGFNTPYSGVTVVPYSPLGDNKDKAIRSSYGRLYADLKKQGVDNPSICFLCSWNKGAIMVSKALNKGGIPHQLSFDENTAIYSGFLIACLMEPIKDLHIHLLRIFEILKEYAHSKNKVSEAEKYEKWISSEKAGRLRKTKTTKFWKEFLERLAFHTFTGTPKNDWIYIRQSLINSGVNEISKIASGSRLLFALQAGKGFNEFLINQWLSTGTYEHSQSYFQIAYTNAQLERSRENLRGVYVMTTYKAKGKEFDGVILFQNNYHSPFDQLNDVDLKHSKRVFFVALTRAKSQAYILIQGGASLNIFSRIP